MPNTVLVEVEENKSAQEVIPYVPGNTFPFVNPDSVSSRTKRSSYPCF